MVGVPKLYASTMQHHVVRVVAPVCLVDGGDGLYVIRPVADVLVISLVLGAGRGHGVARGARCGEGLHLACAGTARPRCTVAQHLFVRGQVFLALHALNEGSEQRRQAGHAGAYHPEVNLDLTECGHVYQIVCLLSALPEYNA